MARTHLAKALSFRRGHQDMGWRQRDKHEVVKQDWMLLPWASVTEGVCGIVCWDCREAVRGVSLDPVSTPVADFNFQPAPAAYSGRLN